jgi:hypothetical protein
VPWTGRLAKQQNILHTYLVCYYVETSCRAQRRAMVSCPGQFFFYFFFIFLFFYFFIFLFFFWPWCQDYCHAHPYFSIDSRACWRNGKPRLGEHKSQNRISYRGEANVVVASQPASNEVRSTFSMPSPSTRNRDGPCSDRASPILKQAKRRQRMVGCYVPR